MLDKIAAVIYVITFGFAYYRMFVLPKGNRKLNGVTWILLTLLLEASGQALVAGIQCISCSGQSVDRVCDQSCDGTHRVGNLL